MRAIVSIPAVGEYVVRFYYREANGRTMHNAPVIEIPCDGYKHALAVMDAYNGGWTDANRT